MMIEEELCRQPTRRVTSEDNTLKLLNYPTLNKVKMGYYSKTKAVF